MNKKFQGWTIILVAFFGLLWSYSLSTRFGLFFILPLGLKIIVLVLLGINSTLLAYRLVHYCTRFRPFGLGWSRLLVGAVIFTGLLFLLLPYQRLPFRTTHLMEIKALEEPIELITVYSPDDNPIPRDEFEHSADVTESGDYGFSIPPNASVTYQREQTGGLTLAFKSISGRVMLTWDGTTQTIDLSQSPIRPQPLPNRWQVAPGSTTNTLHILLPGNTWGKPDIPWAVMGALLPIADFVSMVSFGLGFLFATSVILHKNLKLKFDWKLIKAWAFTLIISDLTVLLFKLNLKNLLPWKFLAMIIPTYLILTYIQIRSLSSKGYLKLISVKTFENFEEKIQKRLTKLNQNKTVFWILISIIAGGGVLVIWYMTQPGMGVSGDSVHYLEGARNLAAGMGYVRQLKLGEPVPITGFPPGYPMLLFLGIKLGFDVLTFARLLNLFLFAFYLIMMGWVIFHVTQKTLPAVLAGALSLMSVPVLEIFSWVMSEPLFLTLILVSFGILTAYLKSPSLKISLVLALLSSYLVLVRLAGLSVVGAYALCILIFSKENFQKRLKGAALYGLLALLPIGAFFIRNSLVSASISEARSFHLAPFKQEYLEIILDEIANWFKLNRLTPDQHLKTWVLFLIIGILFGIYLSQKFLQKNPSKTSFKILDALSIFVMVYGLMLLLNVIILAPVQTDYGLRRYTLTLFPIFAVWISVLISQIVWRWDRFYLKIVIFILVIILSRLCILDFAEFVMNPPKYLHGYTSIINECREELNIFENLPEEAAIYTNNCEFIYYASGLRCYHLPLTPESYQPGGEIYQAIANGDLIAYMAFYGFTPTGIEPLLDELEMFQSGCLINFYRMPDGTP